MSGAQIAGVNGMHFGPDGLLYAASVIGSDISINPLDSDLLEIVKNETNGYGADVVAEAVGNPKLLESCFDLIRHRGQMLLV